jgi:hypothetical protein
LTGTGTLTAAREQVRFTRGDVLLDPTDRPYTADMHDCSFALLRVPRPVADDLAEEHTGLPAADPRFDSIVPSPPRPACALLETFPNTTMTSAYIPGPAACRWRRCAVLRHSSTTMPGSPSLCPRSPRPQA